MNAAYDVAQKAIEAKLDDLLEKMQEKEDGGEPITSSWLLSERRYRDLVDQIADALAALADSEHEPLAAAQRGAVEAAETHASQLTLAGLGTPPPNVTVQWNVLPTQAIESIVGFASDGSPLLDLLREMGEDTALKLRDELIAGIARGASTREIARNLKAIVGADNVTGMTRARASNIARTELHRAARAATLASYTQNFDIVESWIWIAACDARTCCCCWAMHGTIHPLSETLDGHPQCRCAMAPRTRSWSEITGDSTLPDTRPDVETGTERFNKLPESDQRAILGAHYDAFAAGEISLADLVQQTESDRWGTMRREATVAEAEANAAKS